MNKDFCPLCDAYGIITPSPAEGIYQEIDVGNTREICGILCVDCSEAGIETTTTFGE